MCKIPFMNARAGESQMKHRHNTLREKLLMRSPFFKISFNSFTNGPKNAFKSVGFPSPHHTEMTIGLIFPLPMKYS